MGKFYATTDPAITEREKENLALSQKMAENSAVLMENVRGMSIPAAT